MYKENKNGKSLKELLDNYFPDESQDDRKFNNLRQQYYRTIRGEIGVDQEGISDLEWVKAEFLNAANVAVSFATTKAGVMTSEIGNVQTDAPVTNPVVKALKGILVGINNLFE